jgi:hypothetical protein
MVALSALGLDGAKIVRWTAFRDFGMTVWEQVSWRPSLNQQGEGSHMPSVPQSLKSQISDEQAYRVQVRHVFCVLKVRSAF